VSSAALAKPRRSSATPIQTSATVATISVVATAVQCPVDAASTAAAADTMNTKPKTQKQQTKKKQKDFLHEKPSVRVNVKIDLLFLCLLFLV